MTVFEAFQHGVGDTARFGQFRERVEILVEEQARAWVPGTSGGWLVIPLERTPTGFYLLSGDREGQRRGREVLQAFVGPGTAVIESVPFLPGSADVDRILLEVGIGYLSHVRRQSEAEHALLLSRLEDAVSAVRSRDARGRPAQPSYVDLLRDFRLALMQRNAPAAERALTEIQLTGRLSAENLRYLKIEMLGRLERWSELRDLDYLPDMMRTRRPREVNEILLEMLWRTGVSERWANRQAPQKIYDEVGLGALYASVLSAVDVPSTEAGRTVGALAALVQADNERLDRLLNGATSNAERERLRQLAPLAEPTPQVLTDIQELFGRGQYTAVIQAFLDAPDPLGADIAVQSVLETQDVLHAAEVFARVQGFIAEMRLEPGRRLTRDLEEVANQLDDACAGWADWCARLGGKTPWPDAERVLRSRHKQWTSPRALSPADLRSASDGLLSAWGGDNHQQAVMGLDLLCKAAADAVQASRGEEFCDAVLLMLADQASLSELVREAYLLLFEKLLGGPTESRYREILDHADALWQALASPRVVDWGIGLVDILLDAPVPAPDARIMLASSVINKARDFQQRLSLRQHTELEGFAEELGLPARQLAEPTDEADAVWHRLDGTVIGLYSLLPRARESLAKRLSCLCSPRAVEGNEDKVATGALKSLAKRADYMIVDTWHASHAATATIDAIRTKDRQILPSGHGVSGFIQALEHDLKRKAA